MLYALVFSSGLPYTVASNSYHVTDLHVHYSGDASKERDTKKALREYSTEQRKQVILF